MSTRTPRYPKGQTAATAANPYHIAILVIVAVIWAMLLVALIFVILSWAKGVPDRCGDQNPKCCGFCKASTDGLCGENYDANYTCNPLPLVKNSLGTNWTSVECLHGICFNYVSLTTQLYALWYKYISNSDTTAASLMCLSAINNTYKYKQCLGAGVVYGNLTVGTDSAYSSVTCYYYTICGATELDYYVVVDFANELRTDSFRDSKTFQKKREFNLEQYRKMLTDRQQNPNNRRKGPEAIEEGYSEGGLVVERRSDEDSGRTIGNRLGGG